MRKSISFLSAALLLAVVDAAPAQNLSSGITYQGTFADNGVPANGNYDIEFVQYRVASGGTAIDTATRTNFPVSGGLINTTLYFAGSTYDGRELWIEVHVRPAGSGGAYTVLSPRQALTAAPYANGLVMPFQRSVSVGAASAFQIHTQDGGTAIEGIVNGAGFPAIRGVAGGVGVEGSSGSIGVNGVGGDTGVRGFSETGQGVRGLGFIGLHGVGSILGVWAQGGLLAEGSTPCNGGTGGCPFDAVKTVAEIRNATLGNLLIGYAGTPANAVFRVNGNGSVFTNGDYNTGGADIAEHVPASGLLEAGDVVEIDAADGEVFRLSSHSNSTSVAGVISTRPGVTLNHAERDPQASDNMPRLALTGRVPVKVTAENGAIHAGDLLVSSSRPGHAMRAPQSPLPGTVIGKAMQKFEHDDGEIEMLVMLR